MPQTKKCKNTRKGNPSKPSDNNTLKEKLLLSFFGALTTAFFYALSFLCMKVDKYIQENAEYPLSLSYVSTNENHEVTFRNSVKLSNAWLLVQGQLVIQTNDHKILKTFIIDDMYTANTYHIEDSQKLSICPKPCATADQLKQQLENYLQIQPNSEVQDSNTLVVKPIGLICVMVQKRDETGDLKYYYILEDETSLTRIDANTAKNKMCGVKITPEIINDPVKMEEVLEETKQQIQQALSEE